MSYILHSTEVQLRTRKVMVPPISMYHLRKLLSLRDEGINLDNPGREGIARLVELFTEILSENHSDITVESLEKEIDAANLKDLVAAMNSLPKNSTALTGAKETTEQPAVTTDQS